MIIIIIHTLNYTVELREHLTVLVPYQNSVLVAIVFIDVEYSTLMPAVLLVDQTAVYNYDIKAS